MKRRIKILYGSVFMTLLLVAIYELTSNHYSQKLTDHRTTPQHQHRILFNKL